MTKYIETPAGRARLTDRGAIVMSRRLSRACGYHRPEDSATPTEIRAWDDLIDAVREILGEPYREYEIYATHPQWGTWIVGAIGG